MSATTPPAAQAPRASPGVPTRAATAAGVRKMPAPMMPPTTAIVAEKSPSRRAYVVMAPRNLRGRAPGGRRRHPD